MKIIDKLNLLLNILENDDEILKFKIGKNKTPIWIIFRAKILMYLLYKENPNYNLLNTTSTLRDKISYIHSFHLEFLSLFKLFRKKEILFISAFTGVKNKEGNYYDRLQDKIYDRYKLNSSVLEHHPTIDVLKNRKNRTASFFLIKKCIFIISKFSFKSKQDELSIALFIQYLNKKLVDVNIDKNEIKIIKSTIDKRYSNILTGISFYSFAFKIIKPKFIILQEAYYGLGNSSIIIAAKQNKIPIAEVQHGRIGRDHCVYNLGDFNNCIEINKYFVDYFLSFGKYYTESISIPSQIIEVGNPELSEKNITNNLCNQLLITTIPDSEKDTTILLDKLIQNEFQKDFKIVIRPHPVEWGFAYQKYKKWINAGMRLSINCDIYDEILISKLIISDFSTILFEALMLKVPCVLINNSYTKSIDSEDLKIFEKIEIENITIEKLNSIVNNYEQNEKFENINASNWQNNYDRLFEKIIGKQPNSK